MDADWHDLEAIKRLKYKYMRCIDRKLWDELSAELSDRDLIELCMLVGHYEMIGMTLNALRVEPDEPSAGPQPAWARVVRRIADRRTGGAA